MQFVCKNCGKYFEKTQREVSKNGEPKFCCHKCSVEYRHKEKTLIVKCEQCGKEKTIKLSEYNTSTTKIFFCSRSCSATYYNKVKPKRLPTGVCVCPECGGKKDRTSKLCKKCSDKNKRSIGNYELGYYIGYGDKPKMSSHKCTHIRKDAKRVLEESGVEKVCAYCKDHQYDSILEVHHLIGVLEHDPHTLIKNINSVSNLVWLCPNHHAMLEKGLISLDTI